eukprot:scaffold4011_cov197-Ochromonas_danica.AAC.10
MTAIIEFGQQTTGMGVSFIDLSHISIAIVCNDNVKIFCALFYDRQDGQHFGRLLCSEILNAFVQDYSSEFAQFGLNLRDFRGFHRKLPKVIIYAVRPVLSHLESFHAIKKAILVRDYEVIDTQRDRLDDFAILSTLPILIELAGEVAIIGNDHLESLSIDTISGGQEGEEEGEEGECVTIWRIREKVFLVCVLDKKHPLEEYAEALEEALEIIEQIGILQEDIQLNAR